VVQTRILRKLLIFYDGFFKVPLKPELDEIFSSEIRLEVLWISMLLDMSIGDRTHKNIKILQVLNKLSAKN
jgi:hypothetical protein